MKNIVLYVVFLVLFLFVLIDKTRVPQDKSKKAPQKSIKIVTGEYSDAKLSPPEPKVVEKEVSEDIAAELPEKRKIIKPSAQLKKILSKKKEKDINLSLKNKLKEDINDEISPRLFTPKEDEKSNSIAEFESMSIELNGKYKKINSLVVQDNYRGFELDESHKLIGAKLSLPNKLYFNLDFNIIDNDTMRYSYFTKNASIGHRLLKDLDIEIRYEDLKGVYRSDYFFHLYQIDLLGLGLDYTLLDQEIYLVNVKAKQLVADKNNKRDLGISLRVPMNEVVLSLGYETSTINSTINESDYKGDLKRKEDSFYLGIDYKF